MLAYYVTGLITSVKSFITMAPGASIIKLFMAKMNFGSIAICWFLLLLLALTNTLAYYVTELIMSVKSCIKLAPGACTIKLFTAII